MKNENTDPRGDKPTLHSVRPWGDIHMVVRNEPCSVDLTHVKPGERASLHSHEIRAELFHFLDDGAYLEVDGRISRPKAHRRPPSGCWSSPSENGPWKIRCATRMTMAVKAGNWNCKDRRG